MSEDLKRLVRGVEGEGPSTEFRARLRAQIVAETEDTDATQDDIVVVVDLTASDEEDEQTTAKPRFGLLVACAAAVLAIVGIWMSLTDDQVPEDITTDTPGEPAEPVTSSNTTFGPGRYRIDTLGTAFTFSVAEEQLGVLANEDGVVSITSLTSLTADDGTITLRRTNLLPHPATPTARVDEGSTWPATDVAGWLDRTTDVVTAGGAVQTTLGGLPATLVELEFACDGGTCRAGDLLGDPGLPIFTPGSTYRLWVVDQGDQDPIVVTVAADANTTSTWFDTAATILGSLHFGAIEPNPVRRAAVGPVDIDAFDGMRVVIPEGTTVIQPYEGFARIAPQSLGGDVEFLTRPLDVNGVEIASAQRMLEVLSDEAVGLTELDRTEIGGRPALVFRVDSGPFPNIVAKTRPEDLVRDEFGWESPRLGHLWLIDTADRGLLVVSAEALDGPGAVEPLFVWTQELLASLELLEP